MRKLVKTTLRIDAELKKAAEREAIEKDTSFQEVVNIALADHIQNKSSESISNTEFSQLLKKVNKEYGPALRKLAKL